MSQKTQTHVAGLEGASLQTQSSVCAGRIAIIRPVQSIYPDSISKTKKNSFLTWLGTTVHEKKDQKKKGCSAINETVTREYPWSELPEGGPSDMEETQQFSMKDAGFPNVCISTRLNKAVWNKEIMSHIIYLSKKHHENEDSVN